MDITIYTKNIQLNSDAETYIQKKFRRLERHLTPITEAKLEISRTSARLQAERIVVQMTITTNSHTLRGQESGLNLFGAIDAVTDVMDRQIQRYKGKVYHTAQAKKSARTASSRADNSMAAMEETEIELGDAAIPEAGKVIRTKRFPMKPMTVADAIDEMELLSHGFFLFFNTDTDEYNVVYRRRDGDYGVIEPDLA